jgi:hypothetical protein
VWRLDLDEDMRRWLRDQASEERGSIQPFVRELLALAPEDKALVARVLERMRDRRTA